MGVLILGKEDMRYFRLDLVFDLDHWLGSILPIGCGNSQPAANAESRRTGKPHEFHGARDGIVLTLERRL